LSRIGIRLKKSSSDRWPPCAKNGNNTEYDEQKGIRAGQQGLACTKITGRGGQTLPKGICYKVLAEGKADGRHPGPRSIVIAHYTGRTIDGRQFDSSRGGAPLAIRLCDLIEGWIVAMQQMCVGDKWEVYIPAEMGYGKFSQPGIPANSTLVFEIELLGIA
jgi:FKBP-type peptidyl-prolyl cis-trans isomerase